MKAEPAHYKYLETITYSHFEEKLASDGLHAFFSAEELALYGKEQKARSLAARWLIKQILIRHFGEKLTHKAISITNLHNGKPRLKLHKADIRNPIHISLSHSRHYITALVIIEKDEV